MYQSKAKIDIDAVLKGMDLPLQQSAVEAMELWREQLSKKEGEAAAIHVEMPKWLITVEPSFDMSIALAKYLAQFNKCVKHLLDVAVNNGLLNNQTRILENGCLMLQSDEFSLFQHLAHRYLQKIALMNERAKIACFTISPVLSNSKTLVLQVVGPSSLYRNLPFEAQDIKSLSLGNHSHGRHFKIKHEESIPTNKNDARATRSAARALRKIPTHVR